jgi:hypothetical protein
LFLYCAIYISSIGFPVWATSRINALLARRAATRRYTYGFARAEDVAGASDADTFSKTPAWPDPAAQKKFQTSRLLTARSHSQSTIDVACAPPGNAAVGGFPTTGTPTPCIAEEVKRNRAMFDYIVNNSLNTQEGLKAAFEKGAPIDMPTSSIAVKGDWVPVPILLQWIPALGSAEQALSSLAELLLEDDPG